MEFDLFKADMESFLREIESPNGVKVAEQAGLYIAEKLREHSFTRGGILSPRYVTRADLINSVDHDQLIFRDEKEIDVSPAMTVNFRGQPDTQYITGRRYDIPIYEVASKVFEKREIELLAYTQPVVKVLEEALVREVEEIEDTNFLAQADAAATSAGNLVNASTGVGGDFTKGALTAGRRRIDSQRLICRVLLMSQVTFDSLFNMQYQDMGSDLLKTVFVEGFQYHTVGDLKLIVSIKDELFRHPTTTVRGGTEPARMMYFFAEEKALGRFLSLERTKFGVRKIFQTIQMQCWEYIGIGIGNIKAVARVTLCD